MFVTCSEICKQKYRNFHRDLWIVIFLRSPRYLYRQCILIGAIHATIYRTIRRISRSLRLSSKQPCQTNRRLYLKINCNVCNFYKNSLQYFTYLWQYFHFIFLTFHFCSYRAWAMCLSYSWSVKLTIEYIAVTPTCTLHRYYWIFYSQEFLVSIRDTNEF